MNLTLVREIDATDVWDLTRAEIEGRRQIVHIISLFRKYGKEIGLGDCRLRAIAPQLGLRETRRVVGEYRLTGDDLLSCRRFDDSVGRLLCTVDLYGEAKINRTPTEMETFTVPYRALLPQGLAGLLIAGRCISCDDVAFGAVRLMVGCALTGQAAGAAAALSLKQGVDVREIDVRALQDTLRALGVAID